MFGKIVGLVTGVVASIGPGLVLAAAPTAFSTTTAVAILDDGFDMVVEMITAIFPILLPVIATLAFIFMIWRYIMGKLRMRG